MFKIILISQPDFFKNEVETLCSLFENGLKLFHLRKPDASKDALRMFIDTIPQEYYNRIVLHSHYSLATEYRLKGIHCTSKSRDEFYKFEQLPLQKSISTHGFCEAGMVDESFAYAFISPVFDSISKPGYTKAYQTEALQQFLNRKHRTEFIALGGISPQNIGLCKDLGFDGVAILGSVWEHQNPLEQWKTMLQLAQGL